MTPGSAAGPRKVEGSMAGVSQVRLFCAMVSGHAGSSINLLDLPEPDAVILEAMFEEFGGGPPEMSE